MPEEAQASGIGCWPPPASCSTSTASNAPPWPSSRAGPKCRPATCITTSRPKMTSSPAFVDAHIKAIEQELCSLERHRTPAARLKALITTLARQADAISTSAAHMARSAPNRANEIRRTPKPEEVSSSYRMSGLSNSSRRWDGATQRISPSTSSPLTTELPHLPRPSAGLNSWPARLDASADGSTTSPRPDPPHLAEH